MQRRWWLVVIGVVALAACAPAASGPEVSVEALWGRSSPKVATAGAFYLNIKNTGTVADALIGAKSTACGSIELHETVDKNGVMEMQPIAGQRIEIPVGGTVELKPGGMHVMCMMKQVDFTAGIKLPLTLVFEKSGEMNFDADIRDQ